LLSDNERDTLTGLLNRKNFDGRILKIMASRRATPRRASDPDSHYCLAILDIDHFKQVNDRFGHLYGDEVLLLFARIMEESFRDNDLLFRYGGEEFIVILKNSKQVDCTKVLERFRKQVESFSFPQVGRVTVSIGHVQITDQGLPTTIIGQADQSLYYAKENGRNQVCSYEKLLADGKLSQVKHQGEIELF
jgi:diguanylate cyclase (GGDEF)-like protein